MQLFRQHRNDTFELVNLTGQDFARGMKQLTIDSKYLRGTIDTRQWKHLTNTVGIGTFDGDRSVSNDAGAE
jgi:hypothetical protein